MSFGKKLTFTRNLLRHLDFDLDSDSNQFTEKMKDVADMIFLKTFLL